MCSRVFATSLPQLWSSQPIVGLHHFLQSEENTDTRLKNNQAYIEHCMKKLKLEVIKSHTHEVTHFDRELHTFYVRKTVDHMFTLIFGNVNFIIYQRLELDKYIFILSVQVSQFMISLYAFFKIKIIVLINVRIASNNF
jgi:adenine-specific DNA glycosylase